MRFGGPQNMIPRAPSIGRLTSRVVPPSTRSASLFTRRAALNDEDADGLKRFSAGGVSSAIDEPTVPTQMPTLVDAAQSSAPSAVPSPAPVTAAPKKKKVAVVGAGWAGFGAAYHLSKEGYDVTLVDASATPGGLSASASTANGKTIEAGMKGFWYEYANIFHLIKELDLPEWPLTSWTTSGLWNPKGLVTQAPIFSDQFPLPTLLGQFVHTLPLFKNLPLEDRATMFPLLLSLFDFESSEEQFKKYDQMTARELFRMFGISQRMYDDFLKPILLVGLFAPPEDLSAAVMLQTFKYYALAHQDSFDVCWCRGSIAEKILAPMVKKIEAQGGRVLASHAVEDVLQDPSTGEIKGLLANNWVAGRKVSIDADAVVFCVGISGMQKIVSSSKILSDRPEFRNIFNLKALDVISTRLWFDKRVETQFPANVIVGFEPETGGTYFNLNTLHDEFKDAPGSVIAADFYHSNTLMPLSDEQIARRVHDIIMQCEPAFKEAKLVDHAVLKFSKAVTHFNAGSFPYRPTQKTSFGNVFFAGDWVRDLDHGANGLSQERAYVTGMAAANLVSEHFGRGRPVDIKPVRPDEPHIALPTMLGKNARQALEGAGIRSPFLF